MNRTTTLVLGTTAVIASLALAGCADTTESSSRTSTSTSASAPASASPGASAGNADFADQDVLFAQMMLPHHEQAVEMANDIVTSQTAQIEQMATLLRSL
ncbi:DUF305 domain-containing protein [Frigoribacterium sp. VKM Ac-2836]|uniref:DUF305 domain-containing protein n=1 Tax=Frigoribacterium sp. VKM Ac-2836 TaxID=2739014 RepID=UPI001564C8C2|nr:DUF305 domain-containing protein [Frigoribacterium sp. VKM Ac-2836]NRD26329.1 DUF305 domain-containing protein [Frigoribacterium sp. VKM Ac-2836]